MAESTANNEEDDDYMADLSRFLPSDSIIQPPNPKSSSKRISEKKDPSINSSKNHLKALNWQERRKIERERKQIEEDEQN
jgi:hypothetical protein